MTHRCFFRFGWLDHQFLKRWAITLVSLDHLMVSVFINFAEPLMQQAIAKVAMSQLV